MIEFKATPPALANKDMAALARTHFGLEGRLTPLASERDQNARLVTDSGDFVLKIANADEDPGHLDMQNAALAHLHAAGAEGTPHLVPTLSGAATATVGHDGSHHALRLVTWLSGTPLSETARTLAQLHSLGAFMGRISTGLQGFGHSAAFRPDFVWSLDHVAKLRPWTDDIAEADNRARVTALFDRYDAQVAPRLPALRASVLHQDANDNNVIVDPDAPDRVTGLIDFGDMAFGRTVNELAITLAYALLGVEDIYTAMRAVIEGYTSEFAISADEADLLYDLARMRLAASVCISSHQIKAHPGNDYLLVSQKPAFDLLARLDRIDPEFMIALCRKAAGHDAIATAPDIRADLSARPAAPVCPPSLARAARMPLLMDGAYPDMPAYSDRAFDDWLARHRPDDLPENIPFYGFGPYGEVRSVYTAEQFADAASPERRTRHMGVDVFGPAGTPVRAPLDGTVWLATYNADPLDYGHLLILEHQTAEGAPFFTLYGHLAKDTTGLAKPGTRVRCLDPAPLLGLAPETFTADPNPPDALIERRARNLSPALSVSYRNKLKIVRGDGPYLIDHTGRAFLDGVNNITHVGHCHPHVVNALAAQAATLNTNTRYLSEPILDYSERLAAKLPEGLDTLFFVNSGSEANELALRIARTALGRKNTVVLDWAYHGNTGGMVDVSPESVSGVGGQVFYPPGYLKAAYAHVRARGGLCIADEVQCGFGRMGDAFWAFETQGVTPDIVVMGKPIGNGHPLAAVATTRALAEKFRTGMEYFNSFGGNPVSMAVGMAVLDVIEREGLQESARDTGAYLMDGLHDLAARYPLAGDVRGRGLFCGIELVHDPETRAPASEAATTIVNDLREQGVLLSTDGPDENVLKFKPPMVFARPEADILLGALDAAFARL